MSNYTNKAYCHECGKYIREWVTRKGIPFCPTCHFQVRLKPKARYSKYYVGREMDSRPR